MAWANALYYTRSFAAMQQFLLKVGVHLRNSYIWWNPLLVIARSVFYDEAISWF